MSIAMIGQFVLSLSLLIVLHECGHFFPARWFNTRVEKFYLFFDPYFALFKKKIGDTEYGIGWLPLGGYVKISGMVDESLDVEQMKQEPQPWEFRSKKAWQRLIIMLGGVTVNFILGFLIFGFLIWRSGEEYLPNENARFGIYADSLGMDFGLKTGDKIINIGGKPLEKFDDRALLRAIIFDEAKTIEVERAGQKQLITLPADAITTLTSFKNKEKGLFALPIPMRIDSVVAGTPAATAGLMKGDKILKINDLDIQFYNDFSAIASRFKNQPITLKVQRGSDTLALNAQSDANGKFGFFNSNDFKTLYPTVKQHFGFAESMKRGFIKGSDFLGNQVKAFGKIFGGEIKAKDSVGGFASIAQMYGKVWDWERFWLMTGSLSLILAFMNLLPIPALDGGYVVFLLWEVITGRKVSDKFMEKAVTVGFLFLMALIVVINFWDVIRMWVG
jgi:regulator of sigma E protease